MGNGMNKIMPGLYVGNYRDSKDHSQLDKFNITHILSIHDTAANLHNDKHYLCILASDSPDQNLIQYFSVCNDFIHAARLRENNVLIHCLAGMSRSVTVAVAYIMSVTELNWRDALKVVRANRGIANPNTGFQKQLQEFENTRLTEERNRLKERFPSLALAVGDEFHCQNALKSYEGMLTTKSVCEGNCKMGEKCPTGVCNILNKKRTSISRKSSVASVKDSNEPLKSSSSRTVIKSNSYCGSTALVNRSAPPSRTSSSQNLTEAQPLKFASAPPTPRSSPQHRSSRTKAPLVDLQEILDIDGS